MPPSHVGSAFKHPPVSQAHANARAHLIIPQRLQLLIDVKSDSLHQLDNTRLAFDTDPTQPGFYVPGTEPQGRFFAPATCDALPLKSGDCAPDMYFTGRWFAEFDFRIVKKFPIGRRATAEFAAEVFNAFDATNFNGAMNPGTGTNTFRVTGAASGARQGQLVWRVSW